MSLKSINPFNNQLIKEYDEPDEHQLDNILKQSAAAFAGWKQKDFEERSILIRKCAENLLKNKNDLAKLMVAEMGKPIKQAIAEIEKCATACEYYAQHAKEFLKDDVIESDASKSFVSYEPMGCIFAVMPWNFPFWQLFRFAAPALMAGNTAVLKHASNVPGCAEAIENIFHESGFPKEVFQNVHISSKAVNYIIAHPAVMAITLTGSEKAGSEVAMTAGKNIKKTVLELGGSDAFIILADADIDTAAKVAVESRMINSGESCIAAKRFIIVKEVYEDVVKKMQEEMEKLVVGDPMDEKTQVGPLARKDLAETLKKQIEESIKKGAVLKYKKNIPEQGAFVAPSILTNVRSGMPAYEEELFGPVAIVIKAEDENDALRFANDSKFGLGTAIFTKNTDKAIQLAKKIESGSVFINGLVKSDPRLPFGGIKKSGYGRELSYHGIREFVNVKTVWVK